MRRHRLPVFLWLALASPAACNRSRPTASPREARAPTPEVSVASPPAAPASDEAPPPRAPVGADASTCEPLQGPELVTRGAGTSVQATTPAECARCGGDWGPHGMAGVTGCLCRTPDAGKACAGPHDCVAECIVDEPGARDLATACPALNAHFPAHCAPRYVSFGCHGIVVEKPTPAGPLRAVRYLCVD